MYRSVEWTKQTAANPDESVNNRYNLRWKQLRKYKYDFVEQITRAQWVVPLENKIIIQSEEQRVADKFWRKQYFEIVETGNL